jgi:hypothetical protein
MGEAMSFSKIIAALVFIIFVTEANAQTRGVPQALLAAVDEYQDKGSAGTCAPASRKLAPGFVRQLPGFGDNSYFVNLRGSKCGNDNFCGTAGCEHLFYHSTLLGWKKGWGTNVRSYRQTNYQGSPAVLLTMHGGYCGGYGPHRCEVVLTWNLWGISETVLDDYQCNMDGRCKHTNRR